MTEKTKKDIWQFPWSYKESFIIAFGLLIVGFAIEYFTPAASIKLPPYPANLIILVVFVFYIFVTQQFMKNPVITWLSSVPAAMSAMTVYTFLILLMGFIPQGNYTGLAAKFGLTYMHSSKVFMVISVYMLTVLGYITIKRLKQKMNLRNFAFFLNHAGLFLIITAASLGSGDLLRLRLAVYENESTNEAVIDNENMALLPFHIHLNSFTVDEYPPELVVFDKKSGMPKIGKAGKFPRIEERKIIKKAGLEIEIKKFISKAFPHEEHYHESEHFGSTQAALISVKSAGQTIEGWISNGNFMLPAKFFEIDEEHVIGMTNPKVNKYESKIDISRNGIKEHENISITVNKPFKYQNWKIYQYGYDSNQGRWSKLSIFELIRDPWLPTVYVGIFMVLFGTLYLLWVGRKI